MYTSCDMCSDYLTPILWGDPNKYPESIWELVKNGQIMIGGSLFSGNTTQSYCYTCNEYYDKKAEIPDDLF